MSNAAVTTPAIIGWSVTSIGIAISLCWNWYNHARTKKTAEDLRAEQYRFNQWSRVRGAIDQALDGLMSAAKGIVHQAQQLDDKKPDHRQIAVFSQLIIDAQDELASALEDAALSQYCEGEHWRDAGHGPLTGTETAWDVVLSLLQEADDAKSKADKIDILKKLRLPIKSIRAAIVEHCRVQDATLDPSKI